MKSNIFKYIFILFVIGIISYAGYRIYIDENNNNNNNLETSTPKEQVIYNDIRLAIAGFDTINPILSNNTNVQDVSSFIFDSLLELDSEYKIKNSLAKEWSKTGDTSYIIKLKENIKWQDGTSFTAYDIQFTIDRLKEIPSIYAYNVQYVIGVEIIDNLTVKINLSQSIPFFEYYLTFPIMSNAYYQSQDFSNKEKTTKSIGTGMYYISSIEESQIILKKNTNYWNKEEKDAQIETITINLYNTMGEVYNAFKMGNIDLIHTKTLNVEDYIGTIGFHTKEYKDREYDFVAINTTHNILSKTEVRKGISYCIDRNSINATVFGGKYYIVDFPLDYGSYLYTVNSASSGYNPDQAKQVLIDNGWEYKYNYWQKVENYKTLRLSFNLVVSQNNDIRLKVAEIIKQNLEAIGIKLNIIKVTENQYNNYLQNKNYELILTGTNLSISPTLSTYFGTSNLANYTNQEIENIINELNSINNEKLLKERYNKLYDIYKNEVPYISLYMNKSSIIYSQNLIGEVAPTFYNIFYNFHKWYREY